MFYFLIKTRRILFVLKEICGRFYVFLTSSNLKLAYSTQNVFKNISFNQL